MNIIKAMDILERGGFVKLPMWERSHLFQGFHNDHFGIFARCPGHLIQRKPVIFTDKDIKREDWHECDQDGNPI